MSFLPLFCSLALSAFQLFTVVGTVRDAQGRSVTGVRIEVIDENFQPIRTIFVDPSGQFSIRRLSPGRYQFKVSTSGTPYEEQSTGWIELQSLRVRGGGNEIHPLDFVLKPKANSPPARRDTVFAQDPPKAAREAYERGAKAFGENKPALAMTSLRKALEIFPDYYDALELLGTELVKAGRFDEALPLLGRAVAINPRAAKSFYAAGVAHLRLDHPQEALEPLTQAGSLNAASPNPPMMQGIAHEKLGQLAEAEAAFKRALRLGGPGLAEAHLYLADLYERQKRFAEAATELETYLKESTAPRNPDQIRTRIRDLKKM